MVALQLDVTDERSIAGAAALVDERCGRLDVLVNNVGADDDTWERAVSVDFATVNDVVDTTWSACGARRWPSCRCCGAAYTRDRQRVVAIGLAGSAWVSGRRAVAAVQKTALDALTRVLAAELRSERILVNSRSPRLGGHRHGWPRWPAGSGGGGVDPLGRRPTRRRPERRLLPRDGRPHPPW